GALPATIAQRERRHALPEPLEKFIMNAVLQNEPAGGGAALPRRAECAPEHALQREIEIGIIQDDLRVLPTHFKRQPLVHPATDFTNDTSRLRGPGERDERHLRMLHDRGSGLLAGAV